MADSQVTSEARRLLGRRLAAYRSAAGYSQHQFAPLVRYTRSTIGNVETGKQKPPRGFWELCDELLSTGGVLAASHDAIQRRERRHQREVTQGLATDGVDSASSRAGQWQTATENEEGSDAESSLTSLLSALTANLFPLAEQQPITAIPLEGLSFSERSELLLKIFLKLDDEHGGEGLFLSLSRFITDMSREVQNGQHAELSAFGQLSQLAGWLALDDGRQGAARRYLNTAVYVAHEADEPALAASALGYMSLQDTYRARTKSALSLAETACEISNGSVTPLVKTMLSTRLARAHAASGNKKASLRAIDIATSSFATSSPRPEPLWVSYVDEIEVAAQAGACYLELRMAKPAEQALRRALHLIETTAPHRVRDSVHYMSRLAKCHLLEYDVERACATAAAAMNRAAVIGSARVAARLREFRDALEPFAGNPAARDFRELYATTTQ